MTDTSPTFPNPSEPNTNLNPSSNQFAAALVDVFVAPKLAMAYAVNRSKSLWLVWLLISLTGLAATAFYYGQLDIDYANQQAVLEFTASQGEEPTPEVMDFLLIDDRFGLQAMSVLAIVPLSILLIGLLYGLYLFLVSLVVSEHKINYGIWLSVAIWGMVPTLLDYLIMALRVFQAQGQLTLTQLPFSLQTLLGLEPGVLASLATNLTITTIWGWLLTFVALRLVLKTSGLATVLIVAAPAVIFYGASAWLANAF